MNVSSVSRSSSPNRQDLRQLEERTIRRQRILDAAERAFAERGFHEASMTEIARQAGFATGTLYLYFKDKSALYGGLILEKMEQLAREIEGALRSADSAAECLRAMVKSQFAFHDANRPFFEIFLQQTQLQSSPEHSGHWEEMEALKKRIRLALEKCIRKGQVAGELKAGDAGLYAVAFLGISLQIIRQAIREAAPGRFVDSADFVTDCFLHGASSTPSGAEIRKKRS